MGDENLLIGLAAILVTAGIAFIVAGFQWNTEDFSNSMEKELAEFLSKIDDALFLTSQVIIGNMINAVKERKKMREEEHQAILSDAFRELKNNIITLCWEEESPLRLSLEQRISVASLRNWESRFSNSLCFLGVVLIISAVPPGIIPLTNLTLSYELDVVIVVAFLNLIFLSAGYVSFSRIRCRSLKKTIGSGISKCRTKLEKLRKGGA